VLEAVAEPSEPDESADEFDAKSGGAGGVGDRRRATAARQLAAAARRRRRKASEAGKAAAAAGGFTEPLGQGDASKARGRRAYLPATLVDEEPKPGGVQGR